MKILAKDVYTLSADWNRGKEKAVQILNQSCEKHSGIVHKRPGITTFGDIDNKLGDTQVIPGITLLH